MLGSAKRPQEHLGGVVEALQDGVGTEVEGLATAVGGDASGEVDAQSAVGELADGDVGTAAQRDVDRLDLLPARKPSMGVDRVLEQAHMGDARWEPRGMGNQGVLWLPIDC